MKHCVRICTLSIIGALLLAGAAQAEVCLYADFDEDGDPWTLETFNEGTEAIVSLILEAPPVSIAGKRFFLTVEEGCCEDYMEHAYYGVSSDFESVTFDPAFVDSFVVEIPTCIYCCPWMIVGRFAETAPMVPGERYFIGTFDAHSICDPTPPYPCYPPCTVDLSIFLPSDEQCEDAQATLEFWCDANPVEEGTWGMVKALYR